MVVDTSAIIAILLREADAKWFAETIEGSGNPVMSAGSYLEAGVVTLRRLGPDGLPELDNILGTLAVAIVPVTEDQARLAIAAYARFGKGRHPAALNYGDCFSYALAQARGEPLLAKGDDFVRTDVQMAVAG